MKRVKIKDSILVNKDIERSFNMLKANIDYYGGEQQVIAVTSCRDKEGKSFVTYRLAMEYAKEGKRVLLLMTDYRKTMGSGVATLIGLAEVLDNRCNLMDVLYETDIKGMHIMFAGDKSNDKDISIDKDRFAVLVNCLKNMFDIVIVDTATVGKTVNDRAVYSQCNSAILVLEPDKVPRKLVKHVREIIEENGCMLVGVTFNNKQKMS